MSSRSSNSLKAFKARQVDPETGLSLVESQTSSVYRDIQHQLITWASQAPPTFNSLITYKITDKNICLNDTSIVIQTSALSGVTGGNPRLCSSNGFYSRIDYKVNGVIKDTAYPEFNHILCQTMNSNDDRLALNNSAGNYASIAQRATLAQAPNQYIIPLNSLFNFANYPILNSSHEVEIVMTLKSLTDCVVMNGATGVPVMTILLTYVQSRISRMPQWIASERLQNMAERAEDTRFHTTKVQSFSLAPGLTSAPLTLSSMNKADIACLFFIVRDSSKLNGDGANTFNKIASFSIRDSANNAVTGSQEITDALALNYLSQFWSNSTVQSETSTGSQLSGVVTDLGQNIYCYSHSSNICDAFNRGRDLGARMYEGNESLNITFKTALTVQTTVDVFCLCQSVLRQGVSSVDVINA